MDFDPNPSAPGHTMIHHLRYQWRSVLAGPGQSHHQFAKDIHNQILRVLKPAGFQALFEPVSSAMENHPQIGRLDVEFITNLFGTEAFDLLENEYSAKLVGKTVHAI